YTGGWGAELAARVAEDRFGSLRAPIRRITGHDVPLPVAPILEDAVVPDIGRITEQIRSLVVGSRVKGGRDGS
ncbi:MAG: transketolase C-terminal domain-containing protein, partial [Actinomycetota bacterium]